MEVVEKKKVLVPVLRFKEFKDAWKNSNLGSETKYTKGFAFKANEYQDTGIRIVRVSDLGADSIKEDIEKVYISETKSQDYNKYSLEKGNIIITTVGSKPELIESAVGRGIYVSEENEGLLNQNMLKFENIKGTSNAFLIGHLKSKRYNHYLKGIARGNANQANITVIDLLAYRIGIPTLPEQQKIAAFLSAVDEKIQQLRQKKALLEKYKKGVMQKLFPKKAGQAPELRFTQPNGSNYPDWQEKKLGEVAKITTGSTPSTKVEEYYNGNRLFVSPEDIDSNRVITSTKTTLTEEGHLKGREIKKGGVLFVSIGSTIGKVAIAGEDCTTNQQINSLEAIEGNVNDFIFEVLYQKGKFIKTLAGVQAVPLINKSDFSNLKFSFPSKEEQQKIADFLSGIDQKINQVETQINQTQTFKKGLLQQMFV